MFRKFKSWIKDTFTPNKAMNNSTVTMKKVNTAPDTAIKKVNKLQDHLTKLNRAYSVKIDKLKQDYDKHQLDYDTEYQKVQNDITQKNLSMTEIKEARVSIQPYEDKLRDSGKELHTVQGYLHEDTLHGLQEIESLQDAYTSELSEQVKINASKLQRLRTEYLQTISKIGASYRTAIATEDTLIKHYQDAGISHQATLTKELGIKTKGVAIQPYDLELTHIAVNSAMKRKQ